jgi:hypothetical protein
MSENAILAAMRRSGIGKDEMTGHGFRAVARTILDEVLGVRPDYIEHQLAHAVRDPDGRAYNRTAHLPERRKMMQQWTDYLDKLKAPAEVIVIRQGLAIRFALYPTTKPRIGKLRDRQLWPRRRGNAKCVGR